MEFFWLDQTTDIKKTAFDGVIPSFFDIEHSIGHLGSTIKIKIMEKLNELYNSDTDDENHINIVQNLILMLNECNNYVNCVLTSPIYKTTYIHKNDSFKFFDSNIKKFVEIKECQISPTHQEKSNILDNCEIEEKVIKHEIPKIPKGYRIFKLVDNNRSSRKFTGKHPMQAANKAFTALMNDKKQNNEDLTGKIRFTIIESTRFGYKRQYAYIGERIKLQNPKTITVGKGDNTMEITYNYGRCIVSLSKLYINYGI